MKQWKFNFTMIPIMFGLSILFSMTAVDVLVLLSQAFLALGLIALVEGISIRIEHPEMEF